MPPQNYSNLHWSQLSKQKVAKVENLVDMIIYSLVVVEAVSHHSKQAILMKIIWVLLSRS